MVEEPSTTATPGYHADTRALVNRLRRIEGQVRGLKRIVESEASAKLEEATQAIARLVRS
jgi:DNA-binding FrmR family transcriptional regulator